MSGAFTDQAVAVERKPVAGRGAVIALELRRRWFELGVAACALAVGAFLVVRLTAWPPHEDETLALFIGRKSLGGLLDTVLNQRGGAPLHFLLAWIVAHTGGGFVGLRLVSAIFATASVPVIALVGARIAGRATGLAATVICSVSWMLLFHGIYGRMYSLFLFTSALSFLALLNAIERKSRGAWALWIVAILLCIAAHPYGALVLAAQGVFVLASRVPLRAVVPAFGIVAIAGIPFWRTDLVLAGRFDVAVGQGSTTLRGPHAIASYLELVASDFTAGYFAVITVVLLLALIGLVSLIRRRPRSALLAVSVVVVPLAALILAKLGTAAPMSRHLIFILPFFAFVVAEGIVRVSSLAGRAAPVVAIVAVAALLPAEVAWGIHRTPELYRGEPGSHIAARAAAAAWLAATAEPNDVLFGYEPLYMQAWDRGGKVSTLVVPRADHKLALRALLGARKPLGHGVWIFDASDTTNYVRRQEIPIIWPEPESAFQVRSFGPFLVIRTVEPAGCVRSYLKLARQVDIAGELINDRADFDLGDADINFPTVLRAGGVLSKKDDWRGC